MSLNYFLLTSFTDNAATGADNQSIQARYQSLSIVYLNLFQIIICLIYLLVGMYIIRLPGILLPIVTIPLLTVSLILLKKGRRTAAATFLLFAFHTAIGICSFVSELSIAALISTNLLPGICFLITSSKKLHILSFVLSYVQTLINILKANSTFGSLFTLEQEKEVTAAQLFSFFTLATHWMHNHLTKNLENQLLHNAEVNCNKADTIAKELVQALSSREMFVSSLFHEIRNPLNSLNGSISHLLTIIKDPTYVDVLRNVKLSGEVLLNLASNVLDVSKLRAEKIELESFETDPVDAIKKVLAINTENLKKSAISVKAIINTSIPPLVWIDPGRVLQVLMNLMSNAIKFTKKDGEIKLYVKMYSTVTSEEILKQPIESNPFVVRTERRLPHRINTLINPNRSVSLGQEICLNTDVLESQSREYHTNEASSRILKLKYLKGINTKSLIQANTRLNDVNEDTIPWIIIKEDRLSNVLLRTGEPIHHGNTSPRLRSAKRGFLKVQVSDNGCGIPDNMIPKLFGIFAQGETSRVNVQKGAGLGLWICKQLCQRMGGDITLYSKEDQGTTFVFYIPVNIGPQVESIPQEVNLSVQCRVLVVDDYLFNRDLHRLILERQGVRVSLASDGVEAVREYKKQSSGYFDFIMMDVQMPEMDGFTAAKKIRKFEHEKKWKSVDIYFVSGEYYDESEVLTKLRFRERGTEMAQIRSMKKPIDIAVIKKMVENYNNRRKEAISR